MSKPTVIVIGAGPSGIAMMYNLKVQAGIDSFTVYEESSAPGGVWHNNTYPRCGCDVYSHLYSFSFNLNPSWSQELADQKEIEQYMNDTIDKFGLRAHIRTEIRCLGASWSSSKQRWIVKLLDVKTQIGFTREADVLISAVGAISVPKECTIDGHETFTGTTFHSARWNHEIDLTGKRVAVVGNGCSASQFVPHLIKIGAQVTQYARSPQWYHPRPNHLYTKFERWALKNIPGLIQAYRLYLFLDTDQLLETYLATNRAQKARDVAERDSKAYMESMAPAKYHAALLPDYPLGCKRRVFDPDYLTSLHSPNVQLLSEGVSKINGSTITSSSGREEDFDVLILATGYKVQEFLTPLEIYGEDGKSLTQHWKESRGAQAYKGTFVSQLPNFAIIFGPNSFPAHNSVIYTSEVQCEFVRKAVIEPLITNRASKVTVHQTSEDLDAALVQIGLKGMVWEAGCSNWYLNEWGRNTASYPGFASSYWRETFSPIWSDFKLEGGSKLWILNTLIFQIKRYKRLSLVALFLISMCSSKRRTLTFTLTAGLFETGMSRLRLLSPLLKM